MITIILRIFSVLAWLIGLGVFIAHGGSLGHFLVSAFIMLVAYALWVPFEPKPKS